MKKGAVGILGAIVGFTGGVTIGSKLKDKPQNDKKVEKFKSYYSVLNQWLFIKQHGKNLEEYFVNNQYKSIAIYGMGELGNRLFDELENTSVEVKYVVDKEAMSAYSKVDVRELEEMTDDVDAVVVTAIFAMDDIKSDIEEQVTCPIISLEDVVYELA